jgi:hypothetical protein
LAERLSPPTRQLPSAAAILKAVVGLAEAAVVRKLSPELLVSGMTMRRR